MALPPPLPGQTPSVVLDSFSGLKNTVPPEALTAKELSRAQNIDLDDLGKVHRRRGRTQRIVGNVHSVFTTHDKKHTFAVLNGSLVRVHPDFTTQVVLAGFSSDPVAYRDVGPTLYLTSRTNSAQVDLATLSVSSWGRVVDHAYQPSLKPGPADFWFSPVVNTESGLGPVGGKLLGAPPLGTALAWFNGRLYIAAGPTLWGTELFLYNYVDRNKNYRQFESNITALGEVEDGLYVGTEDGLYFLQGTFHEHVRTLRERSGVLRGSMVEVPGELVSPEARLRPELPFESAKAIACVTNAGIVVGLAGGRTYNLTRTNYQFPAAVRAASLYREQDGMNTMVNALDSEGTPANTARFGDHVSAQIIRALPSTPGQPGSVPGFVPPPQADGALFTDATGRIIGEIP